MFEQVTEVNRNSVSDEDEDDMTIEAVRAPFCSWFVAELKKILVGLKVQSKVIAIQNQLQKLTCRFNCLNQTASDFLVEKKAITSHLDLLRKEYGAMLERMKSIKSQDIHSIVSDDVRDLSLCGKPNGGE